MAHRPKTRLDRVRETIPLKQDWLRTEEASITWLQRAMVFHHTHHPREWGCAVIEALLTHLAVDQQVAASTQPHGLSALLWLDRDVLKTPLEYPIAAIRAKTPTRVPTVLTKEEPLTVIACLAETQRLMAKLLSGGGWRLMACLRLRVNDLDVAQRQITVGDGKAWKTG